MRMCGSGVSNGWGKMGRGNQITKAIRCGECQCSIVLNATCYTSMASSYIDAVRKQKKAEYAKQKVNAYLPSLMIEVPDHVYVSPKTYT